MQINFNCKKSPYIVYNKTFWTEGFRFLGRSKKNEKMKENRGGGSLREGFIEVEFEVGELFSEKSSVLAF